MRPFIILLVILFGMETTFAYTPSQLSDSSIDNWFSGLVDTLKADHFMLKQKVASKDKEAMYKAFITGDEASILSNARKSTTQLFVRRLVLEYLSELANYEYRPLKLALGLSDSKILVWAEVNDGDEEMENLLLLTEAKINNKYLKDGFFINSTIIEKSDNLNIPPHYQSILS